MTHPPGGGSEAVRHRDGPAMVLAGPGSGKTHTIISRFQYLIKDCHIHPSSVITLTFTKEAAKEMRHRSLALGEESAKESVFATFHSAFYHILSRSAGLSSSNITDRDKAFIIFTDIMKTLGEDPADREGWIREMSGYIGRKKNGLTVSEDPVHEKVLSLYEDSMRRMNLMDFDDMIIKCRSLFLKSPGILERWQKQFRYIQIDEFQDINPLQYETVKLLAGSDMNIFAVGDDDQSIYAFRGAEPGIMRAFPEETGAVVYSLDTNYRCTQPIVDVSLRVISENRDRIEKDIHAFMQPGEAVDIRCFRDREEEMERVVRALADSDPDECAVLVRTNELVSVFSRGLERRGIPVRSRKRKSIYESETAKDVMSYMRIACGCFHRSDIIRIMNRPMRHFSREAFGREDPKPSDASFYYTEGDSQYEDALAFSHDMAIMGRMKPGNAVKYLMRVVGYEKYAAGNRIAEECLGVLLEAASGYRSIEAWLEEAERVGETGTSGRSDKGGASGNGEYAATSERGLAVMTLHASKGLQFREVFILDVNEGIIPFRRASLPAEIEEERRLLYVGMTRAIKRLHIFSIRENYGKPMNPSRFLPG